MLIDANYVLSRHSQSAEDVPSGLIESHLFDADAELRDMTSDADVENAETIADKEENERTADETRKLEAFKRAFAELVFFFIVPKLNVVISREGVVQSADSKKFGDATFRIASPKEIDEIANRYKIRAKQLVKKWLKKPGGILPEVVTDE